LILIFRKKWADFGTETLSALQKLPIQIEAGPKPTGNVAETLSTLCKKCDFS